MTYDSNGSDKLTPAEKRALDAWAVPPPPADLSSQVLRRVQQQRARRQRARLALVASAAVVVLSIGVVFYNLSGPARTGSHDVAARTTIRVADRAVAVAEKGTSVRWRVEPDGSARVTQKSGNVFYRVEPGGPFTVSTPRGTVTVIGTCFRVEVKQMKASRAGIVGAAAGATLATVVLVSVYEGKVMSAAPGGEVGTEVPAGKVALMEGNGKPTIVGEITEPRGKTIRKETSNGSDSSSNKVALSGTVEQQNRQLAKRTKELESEVEQLKAQIEQSHAQAKKNKFLDLTKEERVALAKRCELRWDTPVYGTDAPTISSKDQEKIGLTDEEVELANEVFAQSHKALLHELRKLYAEVTGDAKSAESLSPQAIVSEIGDKSPLPEVKVVFQRLARERAGMQAPPQDVTGLSAIERMMRLLTTSGDKVEQAIGAKIGPDLARRHRALHGGYGSRSRSSHGCPQ